MTSKPQNIDQKLREAISKRIQKMLNEAVPFPQKPFYFGDCVDDLTKLIQQETTKARIDELQEIPTNPNFIEEYIEHRIKELERLHSLREGE